MLGVSKNEPAKQSGTSRDISPLISGADQYALWNHLILRDVNKHPYKRSFPLYKKEDIDRFVTNPIVFEKQLRRAVRYIYNASSHFRRLIKYFVSLTDFAYVVSPYRVDPQKANVKRVNSNYRKVLNVLSALNIKNQGPKILTVVLRDDVFYGTMHVTADNITIQQLPSDYCTIATIEGNVMNVTFDFMYFDTHPDMLSCFPIEFAERYKAYKSNTDGYPRWQELDSPTSFAIKCNTDIPEAAIPPFSGIIREVYNLEDYKQLGLTKAAIENYAMLWMKLGVTEDGNWQIELDQAKDFWRNLSEVLPDEIGSVLTPMDIEKISFERSKSNDNDTITEAEQNLFTAAGVSSLIFNNNKASANALALSIKADQAMTYEIIKGFEDVINRYIQSLSFGKNFKVTFLDVSVFNRKEMGDQYLKACQYGVPMVSYYCASQGLGQAEMDSMSFLENDVLGLVDRFKPLKNSATMSSKDIETGGEVGRPALDPEEISDQTESNQENF